jgi:hypothetical protein
MGIPSRTVVFALYKIWRLLSADTADAAGPRPCRTRTAWPMKKSYITTIRSEENQLILLHQYDNKSKITREVVYDESQVRAR